MEFTRLRLDHFKCYEAIDIEFVSGTTVVHGVNGSGKSSLLEACFFALYGADALPTGTTLESIITKGERECEVELWFTHGNYQYRIFRSIRETDSQVMHEAVLDTPAGEYSGVRSADEKLEDVLRMDAEAFLNCAYVRQGDITRLLTASPEERQAIIDNLLQLGKLEAYRTRMDKARLGVVHVRKDRATRLEKLQEEIEALQNEDLETRLADVTSRLDELDSKLEEVDTQRETLQAELEVVTEELSSQEEKKAELEELTSELESVEEQQEDTVARLESLEEDLEATNAEISSHLNDATAALRDIDVEVTLPSEPTLDSLDTSLETLRTYKQDIEAEHESLEAELEDFRTAAQEAAAENRRLTEQAAQLREQAESAEERAEQNRATAADKREKLAEKREQLDSLKNQIEEHQASFDADPVPGDVEFGDATDYRASIEEELESIRDREQELKAERSTLNQQIDHAEHLLEEGKCPECGQEVDEAPSVESLDENREKLSEVRSELEDIKATREELESDRTVAKELVDVEQTVQNLRTRIANVQEFIEDLEADIDAKEAEAEEAVAEAEAKRSDAAEKESRAAELAEKRDTLIEDIDAKSDEVKAAEATLEAISDVTESIQTVKRACERKQSLREQMADVESLLEEHESKLSTLQSQRDELEAALDPDRIDELREKKATAEAELAELDEKEAELNERWQQLTETRGEILTKQDQLATKEEEAEILAERVDALEQLEQECVDIRDMYARLRRELRQQNVAQLELLINEIFDLVYESDAYARIELSDQYELIVHEKDGETLAPDELSGGEKALFNLSLRCAIYQLLVEGTGQAALPPLILDEPTVHLDSEHINRIGALVDRMRQLGVSQTIVVSHESEIVDSADERMEVIQSPSSNRSSVSVESTDLLADIEL